MSSTLPTIILNPLDISIALNHGEEIDNHSTNVEEVAKFYAKCKLLDDLKKKKLHEWLMREHLCESSNILEKATKFLIQRNVKRFKRKYRSKMMKHFFGEDENATDSQDFKSHSQLTQV